MIHEMEMDYIISYGIGSVQKRARQRDKKMPKLSKHKMHLSKIGKAPKEKFVVVTTDGSVNNVSNDNSDGRALPGEYIVNLDPW